jgi:hypothetical protein
MMMVLVVVWERGLPAMGRTAAPKPETTIYQV